MGLVSWTLFFFLLISYHFISVFIPARRKYMLFLHVFWGSPHVREDTGHMQRNRMCHFSSQSFLSLVVIHFHVFQIPYNN